MRRLAVLSSLSALLLAQDPPKPEAPKVEPPKTEAAKPFPTGRPTEPQIQPYDRVITKEAKSTPGIFTVHQVKDKYYYEIPVAELGKDFLWVQQIARTTLGVGYGGQALGSRVVRWERRDDKILLRDVRYDIIADPSAPIAKAVQDANVSAILQAVNIAAENKAKKTVVIEVTRLFSSEVPELSARNRLRARGFDPTRSFLDRISAFPTNIEVEATHTYVAPPDAAPASPASPFAPSGMRGNSATVVLHYSMVKLPEKPMMPRLVDDRVGYFEVRKTDFSLDEPRAPKVSYITRWRLEKKDPSAAISDPVKPIVYYVDPATPPKLIPYVKAGIEEWKVAFEAAGFRNAIQAKDAPKDDPSWSPEDARYSVVRWLPSDTENAMGPHINDPRSGEILDSDIQMYHNVMRLASAWYFIQAGPLDSRAGKLPLPDDILGKLVQFVVAHEVGHTLGFPHNMKASSMYEAAKVRDKAWVKKMGHTPSIMDYSRFNYVAQPEDGIDAADLIPHVGPYDIWATAWGYKPVPGAKTPADEKPTLDEWARQQDQTPWFRFMTAKARGADPGEVTEAVGDADPVYSTGLGVKNLERVMKILLPATEKKGDAWDDLEDMYGRVLGQWTREMLHVAGVVGGVASQQKNGGQPGVLFTTIPAPRQRKAVDFLNAQVFATPSFLVDPTVLRRIEPDGVLARLRNAQATVLEGLLTSTRIQRMSEQEAIDGEKAYKPLDLLGDVRRGIFTELAAPAPKIDPYRRNLQQTYLEAMHMRINGGAAPSTHRWLYRGELKSLSADITRTLPRVTDRPTRLFLDDVKEQIARILDPKFAPPAPSALSLAVRRALESPNPEACWQELTITRDGITLQ
jgi:hypothetical protein